MRILIRMTWVAGALAALSLALLFIPVVPFSLYEIAGLAAGVAASFLSFILTAFFSDIAISQGRRGLLATLFYLRFFIYAAALIMAASLLGSVAVLSCGAGLLCWPAATLMSEVFSTKKGESFSVFSRAKTNLLSKKTRSPREQYIYDKSPRRADGSRRYLFVRVWERDIWRGKRRYVTHKKMRVLREIRQV